MNSQDFTVSENKQNPAVCESCGERFSCGANSENCWCFDLNLTEQDLEQLEANFKSCLCRNCLEKVSAADIKTDAS